MSKAEPRLHSYFLEHKVAYLSMKKFLHYLLGNIVKLVFDWKSNETRGLFMSVYV